MGMRAEQGARPGTALGRLALVRLLLLFTCFHAAPDRAQAKSAERSPALIGSGAQLPVAEPAALLKGIAGSRRSQGADRLRKSGVQAEQPALADAAPAVDLVRSEPSDLPSAAPASRPSAATKAAAGQDSEGGTGLRSLLPKLLTNAFTLSLGAMLIGDAERFTEKAARTMPLVAIAGTLPPADASPNPFSLVTRPVAERE